MSTPSFDVPDTRPQPAQHRVCPLAVALGFDWPCACGHTSDACTVRADGTCNG